MQDSTSTSAVLHALKDIGLHLALDDFGTGYSSLNHLKRFPIDSLKIDRSFVQGITTNPDDASIAGAMISMGNHLHMRVVAEGIETQEQLAFLQAHKCPFGQGYYFSKPVAAPECTRLLRDGIAVTAGIPMTALEGAKFKMTPEALDSIRSWDNRCGGDETTFFPVAVDRRRLLEYVDELRAELAALA